MTESNLSPKRVFIAYSHQDEAWKERLHTHLKVLEQQNLLAVWEDRQIAASNDWYPAIEQALNSAQVAILLIRANFLSSKFILDEEMPRLLKRRKDEGLLIIPLILSPCAWQTVPWIASIQGWPENNKPLSSLARNEKDQCLANLALTILDYIGSKLERIVSLANVAIRPIKFQKWNGGKPTDFDVFLSYNSSDRAAVIRLAERLKEHGIKVWLDVWELRPGFPWQEVLEEIIEKIHAAAVLVGEDGIGPWQNREMRGFLSEFVERGQPVIPVLLGNCPVAPKLPFFLKQFTWVDLRENQQEDDFKRLVWGITGNKPT